MFQKHSLVKPRVDSLFSKPRLGLLALLVASQGNRNHSLLQVLKDTSLELSPQSHDFEITCFAEKIPRVSTESRVGKVSQVK